VTEAALLKYAQRAPAAPSAPVPVHEAAAIAARRVVEQGMSGMQIDGQSDLGQSSLGQSAAHGHTQTPRDGQYSEPQGQQHAQPQPDGGVQMRRVPGSREPIESKSAIWATSANQYGRYHSAVPVDAMNAHVWRNPKPASFTRGEPRREANSGFIF
jgi:hypothetical protein